MSLINNILEEWAYRVDDGIPNLFNSNHIDELSIILTEMGLYEIKDELIENLMEADGEKQFSNPLLNKVITYQNAKGEQKKAPIGNLLRLPATHPGRKAAEAMLPKDGTPERKALNKSLGAEKDGKSVPSPHNTKKGGDTKPNPTNGGEDKTEEPQQPDPKAMFDPKVDPAMAARMDTEKETLAKIAKGDTPDEPLKKDTPNGELPSKQQNVEITKSLKDRKSDEGNTMDAETTDKGSILIGVEHGKGNAANQQAIQAIQELPSDTKVMFVGEGGTDRDKKGRIRFYGEQNEFRNVIMNHFDDADESSWDENANVNDDNSPVFDNVAKSLGGSKSKAKAAIWSNMVGQGDDLDADDYLDDEGKQWLIDQAKAGGSTEIDDFTDFNKLSDRQKEDLYQLNYRDDKGYKETEISKAQSEYNNFRQKELDRKIKEAEDKGYTVIAPMGNSHVDLWRKRNKAVEEDSEFKPVEPTDVTKQMPKADSAAFSGQSDIDKITPEEQREISMKIDELNKMTQDAMARGEKAPNYNLCQITVPGTNLYCDNNLGIPREDMPQFKGKPQPGTPAADMPVDKNGEVDTEPLFKKMLADKGIKVLDTEIPSDSLKATQSELVGSKVAGMTKALEKDPNHPSITAPIYVSRDGYVVDGHHRWAAVTSNAIKNGEPANMKVRVIDMDAKDIIPMANKFAEEQGVAAKKADANQEGPKSDIASVPKVEDEKGTKAKTSSGKTLYSVGGGYYSDRPNGEPKFIRTEVVARKAFFEDDAKAFLLIFEAQFKANVEGGKEGTFIEVPAKDRKDAQQDIDATEAEQYEKLKPADKAKLIASKIESNDASFAEADNKEEHTLSLLKNRNNEINKNHMLPPGNPGSSFAENNGAYYIQEVVKKGGKLSKEDFQRILSEMESTPLGQSMPEKDRKRWALIALETAVTEANILLNEPKYNAKNPQPEGYPQGAIMDKQNKASVERILKYKLEEAKSKGDTDSVKHYQKQLDYLKKLAETDTGILYITNDGTIGFKHTSNKSSYDDPHNNTSPAEVMNYLQKHLGENLDPEVAKVFEESLTKLQNASSGIQGDVQQFNNSRSTKTKEEIEKENKTFANALSNFPILGGGRKDYLRGAQGVVSKKWFVAYAKEKGLTEPYEDSDIMNAVFENAASDKPDSSAQKIILKLSEVVEKAKDGNIEELAKKYQLTIDEMATMMGTAGKFFTGTAKSRRDVMAEVHKDILNSIQKADASDANSYPSNPNGNNGPHQKTYVEGFLHRMHFDAYVMGTRDGVSSQNIGGDNVEPEHYRACLGELSGYDGDTTTEEGRKGLVDYLSKRIRISPDNDSISFETREGRVVKLGVDKYRTKGDSKGVLGSLGKDLKTCLKGKAKK